MKTNNIDKNIKEKFQNRTFPPSESAWQRLSDKLDEQPKEKKKKGWVFYTGIAASILVLISIGFGIFTSDENQFQPKEEIVISPIDTSFINQKIDEIKIEYELEEVLVKVDEVKLEEEIISKKVKKELIENQFKPKENKLIIAKVNENLRQAQIDSSENNDIKAISNSSIKVNANDLLFAVTHSEEDVLAYYAKNNIDRKKLLQSIENELKESNVKVNANSILAEVEQNINEDTFKNNFLQLIKKKVSDVASAVASRNN